MHKAIGTSLFIIFINGVAGLLSYSIQGRPLDLHVTALFAAGGAIGGIIGSNLAAKAPGRTLKIVFASLLLIVAAYMLMSNISHIGW